MSTFAGVRAEIRPMLSLAVPVALGELAWMAMGVVDTMMVGRVGPAALGAMSVGRILFMTFGVFGIGLLLGMDTLVSRAFGAGDRDDCRRWLVQGSLLALLLTPPLVALYLGVLPLLRRVVADPEVLAAARGYVGAMAWTMGPLLLYTALRRYLQAVNLVRPVMVAMLTANVVNAAGNWVLVYGNLGAPALGAAGAGWATLIAISYMAAFLLLLVVVRERGASPASSPFRLRPDRARLRALLGLGFPAALQLVLEVALIATVALLAARLEPAALAAHQVALACAAVTYMVPLGISSAAAVRVGQASGRGDPAAAVRAGWTAILISGAFMLGAAVLFVTLPRQIVRLYTSDPAVVAAGGSLLLVAAAFQLFDGVCVTTIGALRGAGDTRNPMWWSLIGYWAVALPVAYWMCFRRGLGVVGLWIGLCAGLVLVGAVLLGVWARRGRGWTRSAEIGSTAAP